MTIIAQYFVAIIITGFLILVGSESINVAACPVRMCGWDPFGLTSTWVPNYASSAIFDGV